MTLCKYFISVKRTTVFCCTHFSFPFSLQLPFQGLFTLCTVLLHHCAQRWEGVDNIITHCRDYEIMCRYLYKTKFILLVIFEYHVSKHMIVNYITTIFSSNFVHYPSHLHSHKSELKNEKCNNE